MLEFTSCIQKENANCIVFCLYLLLNTLNTDYKSNKHLVIIKKTEPILITYSNT